LCSALSVQREEYIVCNNIDVEAVLSVISEWDYRISCIVFGNSSYGYNVGNGFHVRITEDAMYHRLGCRLDTWKCSSSTEGGICVKKQPTWLLCSFALSSPPPFDLDLIYKPVLPLHGRPVWAPCSRPYPGMRCRLSLHLIPNRFLV
jgi:hypothetical protein